MIKSPITVMILISLLLYGCSLTPPTVIGTWNVQNPGKPGNSITYDFKPDGTFTMEEHAAFNQIRSHQSMTGTYLVTGNTLTLNKTSETIGLDSDVMAAIDARERKENPNLHIPQDKGDLPVKIVQPTTNYAITWDGDKLKLKDTSNYADNGVTYVRPQSD